MKKILTLLALFLTPMLVGAEEAKRLEFLPLDTADAAMCVDFLNDGKLNGCFSTPILVWKEILEFNAGVIIPDQGKAAGLAGVNINLPNFIRGISHDDLKYKLDKSIVLGPYISYDFSKKLLRAGVQAGVRFD